MQAIFEELAAAEPRNLDARHSVAIGYEKIGNMLEGTGDLAGAVEIYRKKLSRFQELASADPTNAQIRRNLAVSYRGVGYLQWNRYYANLGDSAGALENHVKALEIYQELSDADPTNMQGRRDLAGEYIAIGDIHANDQDLRCQA